LAASSGQPNYSAFAPTSFATFDHLPISLPMKWPNCSGVPSTEAAHQQFFADRGHCHHFVESLVVST